MARIPGFVGPSNTLQSGNADTEDTINLMYEPTAPGTSNVKDWMPPTPGLRPAYTTTQTDCSGLFEQDSRAFAVIGTGFYEVFQTGTGALTGTLRGTVARNENPPTIHSNGTAGHQLFITSGWLGYIYDLIADTLVQITDPGFPALALMGEFMDGYFIVLPADSRGFQISALENGLLWDPLDVGERSEGSDNVLGMIRSHRELWFLGSQTGEVWYDNGDPDFPFAPIQGVFIEQGTVYGFSIQRLDNTIVWVGKNADGHGVVWRADGYTPKRVSTHAIERFMQLAGFTGIRTWGYQQNGHLFYVVILPTADTTLLTIEILNGSPVYDVAVNSWHKRARWDSTHCTWLQHVAQCHMFAFGTHYVGDRFTGTIYEMSPQLFSEELTVP